MSEFGAIFYRGPSLLTGDPIVGVLTGLETGSSNPKTGPIAQAWILRSDLAPMDAKRQNLDDAVCGDCKLRGRDGKDSGCYVPVWVAPNQVYKLVRDGRYPSLSWPEMQAVLEGRSVRLGAYGDPAAIPFESWRALLTTTAGWVGYTHAWEALRPATEDDPDGERRHRGRVPPSAVGGLAHLPRADARRVGAHRGYPIRR
jgi:hypothetical protein